MVYNKSYPIPRQASRALALGGHFALRTREQIFYKRPMARKRRYFYDDVLDEQQREAMGHARQIEGLDEDIALARTEVHDTMSEVNHDRRLVFHGLGVLTKLHVTRFRIAGAPNPGIEEDAKVIARIFANPLPLEGES